MTSDDKPRKTKISVGFEIPSTLDEQINIIVKKAGYTDRAEFIRAAIREKIERWDKEHQTSGILHKD